MTIAQATALRDAVATLSALRDMLNSGSAVHPGALLHNDESPIEAHVEADIFLLSRAFKLPEVRQ